MGVYSVEKLIAEARKLAVEFRRTTGKPLPGISGEIAEHDAATFLNLELLKEKPGGYDALGKGRRDGWRVQIKGRVIFNDSKSGQRIGQLKMEQDWDSVVLVIMDESYETCEIFEAEREAIETAMEGSTSSSRKKRGAMSVAKFKNIANLVWTREDGEIENEIWDNQSGS